MTDLSYFQIFKIFNLLKSPKFKIRLCLARYKYEMTLTQDADDLPHPKSYVINDKDLNKVFCNTPDIINFLLGS